MSEKIERCGACGDFQNITIEQLNLITPKELDERTETVHCGCENYEEQRYVTRDMAIDAGDRSLEGQPYNY